MLWHNGGMTTDTWLAISAGATFLLAVAAFWAIWQNYSLQKRERRERLLNEIIEWARNITKYRFGKACKELLQITDRYGETNCKKSLQFVHADVVEIKEELAGLGIQSRYIREIASIFGADLNEATQVLTEQMNEYVNYLDEWSRTLADEIEGQKREIDIVSSASEADKIGLQIDESTRKVLEETAKIKAKVIS
jgi:hypothetical protein